MAAAFDYNLRFNFMNERYIYVPVLAVLPWIGSGMEKLLSGSGRFKTYLGYGCLAFCLVLPIGKTIKAGLAPQPVSAQTRWGMAGPKVRFGRCAAPLQ